MWVGGRARERVCQLVNKCGDDDEDHDNGISMANVSVWVFANGEKGEASGTAEEILNKWNKKKMYEKIIVCLFCEWVLSLNYFFSLQCLCTWSSLFLRKCNLTLNSTAQHKSSHLPVIQEEEEDEVTRTWTGSLKHRAATNYNFSRNFNNSQPLRWLSCMQG